MTGRWPGLVDRINAEGGRQGVLLVEARGPEDLTSPPARDGGPSSLVVGLIPGSSRDPRVASGCDPGRPDDARAARGLAMIALRRALAAHGLPAAERVFGLGATSGPAVGVEGPDGEGMQVHVALQTTGATIVRSLALPSDDGRSLATARAQLVLGLVATANGLDPPARSDRDPEAPAAGAIREGGADVASCGHPGIADLLAGRRDRVAFDLRGAGRIEPAIEGDEDRPLILPGSFRPFHAGHSAMAEAAARLVGRPCGLDLSVFHPEKPPLDYVAIASRLRGLGHATGRLTLSNAPTYVEKARVFPGATFVVGHDAAVRILDPKYYGGIAARDAMLDEMEALGTRFLIFGRVDATGRFRDSVDQPGIAGFLARCATIVPESGFRVDLSSTAIRARMAEDVD